MRLPTSAEWAAGNLTPMDFGLYAWPWDIVTGWLWATFVFPIAWRWCERYGHKWGKGGVGFDGEYTTHWCECTRCGYSDSD